jgi:hypothetical protein
MYKLLLLAIPVIGVIELSRLRQPARPRPTLAPVPPEVVLTARRNANRTRWHIRLSSGSTN